MLLSSFRICEIARVARRNPPVMLGLKVRVSAARARLAKNPSARSWRNVCEAAMNTAMDGHVDGVFAFLCAGIKADEILEVPNLRTTLLHCAITAEDVRVLQMLLKERPSLEVCGSDGCSPLDRAIRFSPSRAAHAEMLTLAGAVLPRLPEKFSATCHAHRLIAALREIQPAPASVTTGSTTAEQKPQSGRWSANGLCSEFRVLYPHPNSPGWFRVLTAAGENWAPESELQWCAI